MCPFLGNVLLAVLHTAMLINHTQELVASPRVRLDPTSLLHVRKHRGEEALLACAAAKFEDASASSLNPRDHQRAIGLSGRSVS